HGGEHSAGIASATRHRKHRAMDDINLQPDSIAAQALGWIDEATRAITPPIHVSSTYLRDPDNGYRSGRIYARADNPAFDQAEAVIARLENGARAALIAREDDDFWKRVKTIRAQLGGTLGSFEAWLLLRGMRTLFLRVRAASQSAQRIAEHFARHEHVEAVLYPGLADSHGHAAAARQMHGGFGGMLSIRAKGREAAAIGTAANVALW